MDRLWLWRVRRETADITKIAAVFLADTSELQSGWGLSRRAGLRSWRTVVLLHRMHSWGYLKDSWAARPGRRRSRRYYALTDWGHLNLSREPYAAVGDLVIGYGPAQPSDEWQGIDGQSGSR